MLFWNKFLDIIQAKLARRLHNFIWLAKGHFYSLVCLENMTFLNQCCHAVLVERQEGPRLRTPIWLDENSHWVFEHMMMMPCPSHCCLFSYPDQWQGYAGTLRVPWPVTGVCKTLSIGPSTCVSHKESNSLGGAPWFNVRIRNRWRCRGKTKFLPKLEIKLGLSG